MNAFTTSHMMEGNSGARMRGPPPAMGTSPQPTPQWQNVRALLHSLLQGGYELFTMMFTVYHTFRGLQRILPPSLVRASRRLSLFALLAAAAYFIEKALWQDESRIKINPSKAIEESTKEKSDTQRAQKVESSKAGNKEHDTGATTPSQNVDPGLPKATVLYDFNARDEKELSVVAGEEVWVHTEDTDSLWTLAQKHLAHESILKGWIPSSYLRIDACVPKL